MSMMFFRIAAILWLIWGAVHAFAGVMVITNDTGTAGALIADAVDPALFEGPFPDAMGAIVNQHGFNLLWFGVVTMVGALFVWSGDPRAIFLNAIVGGLADLGYFLFLDLGGHVHFIPGTLMTVVSASAIILSVVGHFRRTG